ncbi:DUF262 domain-containing protein [Candidatus Thiodictyon syntrophicum]|jgi:hypothetical protein|uniref:GmrSD restriction endonucleases N-terminal domain-containing protein n=1 Tax=Candidatus Thiodictyon syntrophicum TaxID=1166950 RepID=A0A2K8U561_9GAMM|nr:DUF262 domain-containing protein [Candidatus Thiodictyon syntrophicum]AUB80685.1 hypothetical protein THSYN_06780 [Candidatus Thiodictyon syntrophicum]
MASTSISQPVAKTLSVVDLVGETLKGRIRIPEFQRPLRWQWEDVRRLFDSIVKGYPIGSVLLWIRPAPEAAIRLGGLRIPARQFDDGWWVVDGQQRLTSLANALSEEGSRDDRFALAYDLEQQTFCHPSREDLGHIIPLPVLFDLQRLIRWFTKEHPEAGERLDEASRVTRAIREYQVPAYLVSQEEESVLRDIFDRMNNYGKRLSRAEVFAALHPAQGSGLEPTSRFQQIAESIDAERGFGLVDDDTVLRSVLARRGGDVTRDIRVEFLESTQAARDFGREQAETTYWEGAIALSRAVAFLQEDAGVPHFAFLPYRYLLVVLTRFFAHFPEPEPRNRILLRRWFWRAAMVGPGPFTSSWTNAMRTLATRISRDDESGSVQRLLASPFDSTLRLPPLTGFRTSAAASRIVLSALWALRPRSLLSGRPYDRSDLAESMRPEGTPAGIARRILNRAPNDQLAWAANRILVLDQELPGTPADLLVSPPLERENNAAEFLASHALDDALVSNLAQGDKTAFLNTRQQRLMEIVRTMSKR